ncbi:sulfur deprivation response regulator [Methanosarcina sp. MTP4]|uniref:SLC13 family permease n=1 Tax=Methanosarcina sp. MTP4 TaxID=1434100 RepID=UPI000615F55D|nr:SLC13 family permease [Methanosarcina sp. MTP4]AKB24533.1 sulfur deprivation response regulator [Methanosarcina sp. MTP4]
MNSGLTPDILLVLLVLAGTIVLFVGEFFRVDVTAGLVMLTLAWTGLVSPKEAFSGFGSNAVMSIIGVMILGRGIDRTGLMNRVSRKILSLAGSSERRLLGVICTVVGLISAFMQNIGSVALFLPAVLRISRAAKLPASRLLMPMGFAGILGGTLTMVGSGPLIILNDLLRQGGQEPFGLFSVTPIGLALLFSGIAYFLLFGKYVLPSKTPEEEKAGGRSSQQRLIETWQLPSAISCFRVPDGSPLSGMTREESGLWRDYGLHLLALLEGDELSYAPWRYTRFASGQVLALLGEKEDIGRFASANGLEPVERSLLCTELSGEGAAGFAEIIIRPRASISGKTLKQIALRKHFGVDPILLLSGVEEVREDFSDQVLQAGATVIVYGPWNAVRALGETPDFVLLTPVEEEKAREGKVGIASLCFLGAIGLAISGFTLSLSLLSGALAMVLFRVLSIEEAYRAVDWRTVLLLAGLIPLGIAMDSSGAAAFVAGELMKVVTGSHPLLILFSIAVLTTLFSLFMSNVAATVLLVPLVLIIGESTGLSPGALALLVAVSASNSFVLPTHQVNALLIGQGGYHNTDYIKAGGVMTLIFLLIAVGMVYFYL